VLSLTKTEMSLVIMAEYCHNSCSKCLSFARTQSHAWGRSHHSSIIALSMMVRSMTCQIYASNAASVHNTYLHKMVFLFYRNLKLKQQINKLNALNLGVCSIINAFYICVCIFFHICQNHSVVTASVSTTPVMHQHPTTSNFRKVVWQHTEGVVGSTIRLLLEI